MHAVKALSNKPPCGPRSRLRRCGARRGRACVAAGLPRLAKASKSVSGFEEAWVNYVHVEDVVHVLMLCSTCIRAEGETFNVSQSTSVENMIKSFMHETQTQKNMIRLPEFFVRIFATIFEIIPKFPLTNSRINALTNKCVYSSAK